MSLLKLSPLPTVIGIFQLMSHLIPTAYAAAPMTFDLEWETHNLTGEEAGSRYIDASDYTFRSGIKLELGTPRQVVYLTPLISEKEIFIIDVARCYNQSYCEDYANGLFAPNDSSTWEPIEEVGTVDEFFDWWFPRGNYTLGTEVGEFPGASINLTLDGLGQDIGLMTKGENTIANMPINVLGLGNGSKFLDNLVDKELIAERAFGFYNNTLDIGGIDEDKIEGERFASPIMNDPMGGLRVTVTGMEINGRSIMTRHPEPFNAALTMIWSSNVVPDSIFEEFMNMTGGALPDYSSTDINTGGLIFPGWNDTTTPYTDYNLTVTLANGLKLTVPERSIRIPMRSDNRDYGNASMTTIYSIGSLNGRSRIDDIDAYFGLGFLNMTYLYVDYERQMFELANAKQLPVGSGNGGNGSNTGGDPSSASFLRTNLCAWVVVLFSSMLIIGGVF